MIEYKSTQHFIAMLSSEQIYISALKTKMGEWNAHFDQIKIKEWMQEFLDEKVSAEIIRYTMLTCADLGLENTLQYRLDSTFGSIYQLMVGEGIEISVTLAWRMLQNSIQYGYPPEHPMDVWYSMEQCLEAKTLHDETASTAANKRGRTGDALDAHDLHAWLEQMKGLSVTGLVKD